MPALFALRWWTARGLTVAVLLGALASRGYAQEPPPRVPTADAVQVVTSSASIEVIERTAKVVEFKEWLTRVDGFDPRILNVTALDKNKLRVQGLDQGVTTMVVTDKNGQAYTVEVFVTGDARLLQSVLNRAFPNSAIQATMLRGNAVLLRGWVTDAQQIASITELANLYSPNVVNQVRVGGPQEVQLRVKIMEVQRSKLRTFGFNFSAAANSFALASTPGPITPLSALTAPIGGTPTTTIGPNGLNPPSLAWGVTGRHFAFEGFLQALKEEGLLKIQAEPVLVTRSGEAARLANGGEFPIPVPQSLGTITIEWREFGVILEALPIVISPTRLRQQVSAEVSERDVSTGVSIGGTTVPGLTRRHVQSTVEMEFGQTLVLGGLISTRTIANTQKTPFLGELPKIGAAFSKKRHDYAEVELIVMITPEYVSALTQDQLPPLGPGRTTTFPTDRELYCNGLIEVPRIGPECPDGMNCDPNFSCEAKTVTPWPGSTTILPSPTYGPQHTPSPPPGPGPVEADPGLIAPPGASPPSAVPPPPAVNPPLSSRSKRESRWPSSSRPVTSREAASSKTASSSPSAASSSSSAQSSNSGATQAGYQSPGKRSDEKVQTAAGQKPAVSKPLPPTRF